MAPRDAQLAEREVREQLGELVVELAFAEGTLVRFQNSLHPGAPKVQEAEARVRRLHTSIHALRLLLIEEETEHTASRRR